jgi:hypothetical protein
METRQRPAPETSCVDAESIARRALLLQAIHLRGWLEDQATDVAHMPIARAIDRVNQLTSWVADYDLEKMAVAKEIEFLHCPVGKLDSEQVTAAYWKMDTLGVLAWAVRKVPALPAFDAPFDAQEVLGTLPRVGESPEVFLEHLDRRPVDELEQALEAARLWQQRAELHLIETARLVEDQTVFDSKVTELASRAAELGALELVVDGDFFVMTKPYRALDQKQSDLLGRLASERFEALTWICGRHGL